jgi:hypothetical protein
VGQKDWMSVKVAVKHFNRLKAFCTKSGQPVAFHTDRAMANYIADELPIWEAKLKVVEGELKKH